MFREVFYMNRIFKIYLFLLSYLPLMLYIAFKLDFGESIASYSLTAFKKPVY